MKLDPILSQCGEHTKAQDKWRCPEDIRWPWELDHPNKEGGHDNAAIATTDRCLEQELVIE